MRCPACQVSLVAGSRYCHRCGSPTTAVDPPVQAPSNEWAQAVQRLLPTGYLQHVLPGEGKPASERRVVTTLFIDLVNSTGIAENLDPEDATELVNLAFSIMAKPIRRYEGTIARLMGDGMLCLFGAPVAHEDDPVRACRAALEVIEGFREAAAAACAKHSLTSFTVRAGISTGLAVVGEVGAAERAEYTAIGDAVNLAARLQAVTEPGTVLICTETWRHIRHRMASQDMGPVTVRGKSQPISVYRLLPSDSGSSLLEDKRAEAALIGRREEVAVCQAAVSDLMHNRSSILLINGEAGMGKSRLIEEVRSACPRDAFWVEAHSLAHTRFMNYWTTRDLLHGLLRLPPDVAGRKLGTRMRQTILSLFESSPGTAAQPDIVKDLSTLLCAVIGHLLHAPLRRREQKYVENLEAGLFHEQIAACICTYVNLVAQTQPLVLVWEDVQWVDVESRQILQALSALSRDLPVLLIIACRPHAEQPTQWLDNLMHCAALPVRTVQLSRLSDTECRTLLQQLLAVDEVPEHIAVPLLQASEGNPHFIREMTQALVDYGQLVRADRERLSGCKLGRVDIPRSVQAAILSRIDMLEATAKRVIQTASVLGRDIDIEVVHRMLAPEVRSEACDQVFKTLEKKGFVAPKPTSADEPQRRDTSDPSNGNGSDAAGGTSTRYYSFVQALTQEVVYQSMLKSQRQRLHQRAGEAIEQGHSSGVPPHASILAYHFDQGGDVTRAVRYLGQSAEYAAKVCAVEAAAEAYQRALLLTEHIGSQVDKGLLALLHEGLADVYYLSSRYSESLGHYDKAMAVHVAGSRCAMLALKRGRLFEKWGRYDDAQKAFEAGLDCLTHDYDPQLAAKFYAGLCLVYYHLNELTVSYEFGQLALELERSARDDHGIAQACNNLGIVSMKQQDWPAAEGYFEEGQSIWERLGDTYGLATGHNNLGLVAKEQGRTQSAIQHYESSLALFTRLGNKHGMARVYDNLAELLSQSGDMRQAEEYLGKAVAILAEIGVDSSGPVAEIWQSGVW